MKRNRKKVNIFKNKKNYGASALQEAILVKIVVVRNYANQEV